MKKYLTLALLAVIAIMLFLIAVPQSCTTHPSVLEQKAIHSLLIDSIEAVHAERLNAKSDSIVSVYKDSISKIQVQEAKTRANYYALRKVLKQYQVVKVDSSGQTIEVPISDYNASINSGNMCDSLIMFMDAELMIKDSIISTREIQLKSVNDLNKTHEQTLQDLIALNNEEKKQGQKAHKLNKRIPLIAALSAFAGSLLTIILIK